MYKKILVPLDGSGLAETALPHAITVARGTGSEIILLRIVVSPMRDMPASESTTEAYGVVWRTAQEDAERYLASVRYQLRQQQVEARSLLVEGPPLAGSIVDAAVNEDVDVIVMSTHGRSGLARWVFGSVAQKVLQQAPCPVLLVPARQ